MAKSIRNKSKLRHRNIRREQIYKPVEDKRLQELATLQANIGTEDLPKVLDTMEVDTKPVRVGNKNKKPYSKHTIKRRKYKK